MVLESIQFGKLISAESSDHHPYDDWRSMFMKDPGAIKIFRSQNHEGKYYVYFYPLWHRSGDIPVFHTSIGDLEVNPSNNTCTISTENSIYCFEFGDFGLTEEQKNELIGASIDK